MRPILILAAVLFTASASAQDAQTPPPAPAQNAPAGDTAKLPLPAEPMLVKPTPLDQKKFDTAAAAYDAKDYDTAYKLFTELADEYDVAAMRNVALMTRDGLGCEKDPQRAEDMMEEAAKRGLPTAQYDLGEMLLTGAAGDPDRKAALPWLELAASAGHPLARKRSPTLRDLHEQPFVMYSPHESRYFHELVVAQLAQANVQPRYVQYLGQVHSLLSLVRAGLGLALVPESATGLHLDNVVMRPVALRSKAPVEVHAVWRRDAASPLIPQIIAIAKRLAHRPRRR